MIAAIALFIPPMIMVSLRERIVGKSKNIYLKLRNYAAAVLMLNFVMLVLCYVAGSKENLVSKINQYNHFAIKYILLSVLLAAAEPYAELFLKNKLRIRIEGPKVHKWEKTVHWRGLAGAYALCLLLLNILRIFDGNFWGDEAFTLNLIQKTIPDIVSVTAADVHPPLYYLILRLCFLVSGKRDWMFHFVSLLPCMITVVLAMTVFWRQFGKCVSAILITLVCLSGNAVIYNVEVRMYSWGGFFVLLSFYEVYCILRKGRVRDYVFFTVFSLAAAYTHYYCLVSVAFFYLALLFLALSRRRLPLGKVMITCVCTFAGYLPWTGVLLKTASKSAGSFWIEEIPSVKDCILYLFSNQFAPWVWYLFLTGGTAVVLYETGILELSQNSGGLTVVSFGVRKIRFSDKLVWMATGIFSVAGTISFGIIVSEMTRPLLLLRYIYPVSMVMWMVFGVTISSLKGKKVYAVILMVYMLLTFIPAYQKIYMEEKQANDILKNTLDALDGEMKTDDVILTTVAHVSWSIGSYYFPGIPTELITFSSLPELNHDSFYWLIVEDWQDMEKMEVRFAERGFLCKQVVKEGILGANRISVYRLSPVQGTEH